MEMPTESRSAGPAALGICDTHFHVFGPYDRFPLPASPSYAPEEAPPAAYREMADKLGIARWVVVQGACYGADNRAMLAAIQALGAERARGIAVLDGSETGAELRRLNDGGVRGIRINAISNAGIDARVIRARAATAADLGWHVQFHARPEQVVAHATLLRDLPVDVVIDHCARIDPREGPDQPAMRAVLDLLATGRSWIKLIAYRCVPPGGDGSEMRPFLRRLAAAVPERCLWGTDWPHPLLDSVPETDGLLAEFRRALDDQTLRDQILRTNAEPLYDFH
jgi:predicted TIM-barrel fold metal-dependent hydrolase